MPDTTTVTEVKESIEMVRNPLDKELEAKKPTLNPKKRYEFTWPGQKPKTVTGEELAAILKGADHTMLDIKEVGGEIIPPAPEPEPEPEPVPDLAASDRETTPGEVTAEIPAATPFPEAARRRGR